LSYSAEGKVRRRALDGKDSRSYAARVSNERAEGFWWVRERGGVDWQPACVWGRIDPTMCCFRQGAKPLAAKDFDGEWGPYLGKEPGDILRRIAAWVRDNGDSYEYAQQDTFGSGGADVCALACAIEEGKAST
jgi:hypothetical protein